jgi:hypothetical protein
MKHGTGPLLGLLALLLLGCAGGPGRTPSEPLPDANDIYDVTVDEISVDAVRVSFRYAYTGDQGADDVYVGVMSVMGADDSQLSRVQWPGHAAAAPGTGACTEIVQGDGTSLDGVAIRIVMYVSSKSGFREMLKKDFPFAKAWSSYPETAPEPLNALLLRNGECLDPTTGLDYLIVTRPLFEPVLAPFVEWKTSQGFRVGLVTVDWLADAFPGRHLAEKMKNGLHRIRETAGLPTMYVLLVGDTEIAPGTSEVDAVVSSYDLSQPWNVPTGFYRRIETDPPRSVLPSDAYFTEEKDWDPANTGVNPVANQASGAGAFEATLFLGRWPARRPGDVSVMFEKTRRLAPASRILFAEDAELADYSQADRCVAEPFAYPFGCYVGFHAARMNLFGPKAPWLVTDYRAVDRGRGDQATAYAAFVSAYDGIIDEVFHGTEHFIGMPGWDGLMLHDYPLLVSNSCSVSTFYQGSADSASEMLMKATHGPALFLEPPNQYLFLKGIREGRPAGEAFWRGGATYVYWPNPITFLGDPSLVVMRGPG